MSQIELEIQSDPLMTALLLTVVVMAALLPTLPSTTQVAAASQQSSIAIEGPIWDHYPITVLLNTTNSQYLDSALSAIRTWRAAIRDFATGYVYPYAVDLARLDFSVYLLGVNATLSSYDVTISFTSVQLTESNWAGVTYFSDSGGILKVARVWIETQVPSPQFLSAEMQTVTEHELGHALGLGHSSGQNPPTAPRGYGDLMNGNGTQYVAGAVPTAPSTLDVFALAKLYLPWLATGNFSNPGLQSATLPPSIRYRELALRCVSIMYLPFLVNGQPGVKGSWYLDGYTLPNYLFDVSSSVTAYGVIYSFRGWYGDGAGSYTGPNLVPAIKVAGTNISEIAIWSETNQASSTVSVTTTSTVTSTLVSPTIYTTTFVTTTTQQVPSTVNGGTVAFNQTQSKVSTIQSQLTSSYDLRELLAVAALAAAIVGASAYFLLRGKKEGKWIFQARLTCSALLVARGYSNRGNGNRPTGRFPFYYSNTESAAFGSDSTGVLENHHKPINTFPTAPLAPFSWSIRLRPTQRLTMPIGVSFVGSRGR